MIEVQNLVYEYPTKRALDGVSLRIEAGTITALVGPNGAGKTTLMRCIAALEMPYSGRVLIDGRDTREEPRRIHEDLSFLPDFFGLYDQLSVARCLTFAARAHGLTGRRVAQAVEKAAARVGLTERMSQKAAELSRGLRQRLAIGQAIVHEPKVILLDEPASGLDPDARRSLSELFLELKASGITLIVSSHILSELEDYSSSMLIVQDGKLVSGQAVSLTVDRTAYTIELEAPAAGFADFLLKLPGVRSAVDQGKGTQIVLDGPAHRTPVIRAVLDHNYPLVGFSEVKRTLEQTYLEETRKAAP
ncbi:Vitamin B12 import ATP-binding protein BtuD [Alphaproteobacteria bacterium SO-S41]|nr:Vitamin B12 import ATP-binding protein BtuD [Alphaproteobacteria bacterium SO-S41]